MIACFLRLLLPRWKEASLFVMGNTVRRFPETLDPKRPPLRVIVTLTQTGSGLSFMALHQHARAPSCRSTTHIHKQVRTDTDTHTLTRTQLVFLFLLTLARLWRLCMVFTSNPPNRPRHPNWLPAHPSLLSFSICLRCHVFLSLSSLASQK